MKRIAIIIALALVSGPACGMKKMTTKVIGRVSTDGMVAIESESDVEFAKEAMPALIKTLEVLSYGDPKDPRTLALLAKAYGTYSFGFLEGEMLAAAPGSDARRRAAERVELFYGRGKEYGLRALKRGMGDALNAPYPKFKKALAGLGKKHVPALFWTAFNWANWLNLNRDDPTAVAGFAAHTGDGREGSTARSGILLRLGPHDPRDARGIQAKDARWKSQFSPDPVRRGAEDRA